MANKMYVSPIREEFLSDVKKFIDTTNRYIISRAVSSNDLSNEAMLVVCAGLGENLKKTASKLVSATKLMGKFFKCSNDAELQNNIRLIDGQIGNIDHLTMALNYVQ